MDLAWLRFLLSSISFLVSTGVLYIILTQTPLGMKSIQPYILLIAGTDLAMSMCVFIGWPQMYFPLPVYKVYGISPFIPYFGSTIAFVYMTMSINTSLFAILYCSVHRFRVAYNMKTTGSYRWIIFNEIMLFVCSVAFAYYLEENVITDHQGLLDYAIPRNLTRFLSSFNFKNTPDFHIFVVSPFDVYLIGGFIFVGAMGWASGLLLCSFITHRKYRKDLKSSLLSADTFKKQRQLTKIFLVLSLVPIVFAAGCSIFLVDVGLDVFLATGLHDLPWYIFNTLFELYPAVSGTITVTMISPYRHFFLSFFCRNPLHHTISGSSGLVVPF